MKRGCFRSLSKSLFASAAAALAELAQADDHEEDRPRCAHCSGINHGEVAEKEDEADKRDGDRGYDMVLARAGAIAGLGSFIRVHKMKNDYMLLISHEIISWPFALRDDIDINNILWLYSSSSFRITTHKHSTHRDNE